MSRVDGYGTELKKQNLAVCNWAQFQQLRTNIGPVDRVFEKLHSQIFNRVAPDLKLVPMPISYVVGEGKMTFENMWNRMEE